MAKRVVFHPFFLAAYPIVFLLGVNLNQTSPTQALRILAITLLVTLLLLLFLRLLTRDWGRAGLILSLWVFFFFGHGHILRGLTDSFGWDASTMNRLLASVAVTILILGTWALIRVVKRDVSSITQFLNVVTAVMLFGSLFTIFYHYTTNDTAVALPTDDVVAAAPVTSGEDLPDIYYIVMDEYTRADIFADLFNYDNSEFIEALEERGFFVAKESYSNYSQTLASLSSSLNYEYVNQLSEAVSEGSEDRSAFNQMVNDNKVRQFLEAEGYRTVSVDSGFMSTKWDDADLFIPSGAAGGVNSFEALIINETLPGRMFATDLKYEIKRQNIMHAFHAVPMVVAEPGPKFVMVHMLTPHPPSVFGPNGEEITPSREYNLNEVAAEGGIGIDVYREAYTGEVTFINKQLLSTVDTILENSATPPVIIIQGDHGTRSFLDWTSVENTCVRERLAILNAYHIPEGVDIELYDSISPVNSFRALFNAYFDTELEYLPDESYFALWERPYEQIDVTDRLEVACPTP